MYWYNLSITKQLEPNVIDNYVNQQINHNYHDKSQLW